MLQPDTIGVPPAGACRYLRDIAEQESDWLMGGGERPYNQNAGERVVC